MKEQIVMLFQKAFEKEEFIQFIRKGTLTLFI